MESEQSGGLTPRDQQTCDDLCFVCACLMVQIIELTGKATSKVPSSARNIEIPGDWGDVTSMLRERPAVTRRGAGGVAGAGR